MPLFAEAADPVGMLPYSLAYVLLLSVAGGPILRAAARRGANLQLTLHDAWRTYLLVNVAFVVAAVPVNLFLQGDRDARPGEGSHLLYLGHAVIYHLALAATISRAYDVPYFRGVWTVFVMTIIAVKAAAIFVGCFLSGLLARELIWYRGTGG